MVILKPERLQKTGGSIFYKEILMGQKYLKNLNMQNFYEMIKVFWVKV
jgi:hypothetical protein